MGTFFKRDGKQVLKNGRAINVNRKWSNKENNSRFYQFTCENIFTDPKFNSNIKLSF